LLAGQLGQAEAELKTWQGQLEHTEAQLQQAKTDQGELATSEAIIDEEMRQFRSKVESLSELLQARNIELDRSLEQEAALETELELAEKHKNAAVAEVEGSKAVIGELRGVVATLESTCSSQSATLAKELEAHHATRVAATDEQAHLQAEIHERTQAFEARLKMLMTEVQEGEGKQQGSEAGGNWAGRFAEVQLEHEADELRHRNKELQRELQNSTVRIGELDQALQESLGEVGESARHNEAMSLLHQEEVQSLSKQLEEARDELSQTQYRLQTSQEAAALELDSMRQELQAARLQAEGANKESEAVCESALQQRNQLREATEQATVAEAECEALRQQVVVLEQQCDKEARRAHGLEQVQTIIESELVKRHHEVEALTEERHRWNEKTMAWGAEDTKLEQLKAQQDASASQQQALRQDVERLKLELQLALKEKQQLALQLAQVSHGENEFLENMAADTLQKLVSNGAAL